MKMTSTATLEKLFETIDQSPESTDKETSSTAALLSTDSSLSEKEKAKNGNKSYLDRILDLFNKIPLHTETEAGALPPTADEDPITSFDKLKKLRDILQEHPEESNKKDYYSRLSDDMLLKFSTSPANTEEETVGLAKTLVEAILHRKLPAISLSM